MIPRTIKSTTKSNEQMPMRSSIVAVVFLFAIACPGILVQSFQPTHTSLPIKPSFVHVDTRLQYSSAGAMDLPLSSSDSSTAAAKNERMRQLVQKTNNNGSIVTQHQKEKASSTTTTMPERSPPAEAPHVIEVSTLKEYKQVVVDDAHAANDQVTAVRFYAPWCRSCRAVEGRFYRLGRRDTSVQVSAGGDTHDTHTATATSKFPNVKFVQVAVGPDNASLHQGLGVTALPYAHIYHQSFGLVEELRMNQKRFGDFEQILQSYNTGFCALPESVDPETGVYEAPYGR
jgi:thiol-disulfide isomerase/thioredoxin